MFQNLLITTPIVTRHVKFLTDNNILEVIFDELIEDLVLPQTNMIVTDTMSIPSKDVSKETGWSYKYKGKKCCKVSLTSDTNGVVRQATVEPGNVHDSKVFKQSMKVDTIGFPITSDRTIKCLADSGYVGDDLYNHCIDHKIEMVVQPRKKRNGQMTHTLTSENKVLLKKYRSIIEHVNSKVRTFRSVNVKYVKKISTFKTFLFVALISITCYCLYLSDQ